MELKNDKGKEKWGYPSKKPCQVCGRHDRNQEDTRFGYTVCWGHQYVTPVQLNDYPESHHYTPGVLQ